MEELGRVKRPAFSVVAIVLLPEIPWGRELDTESGGGVGWGGGIMCDHRTGQTCLDPIKC